MITTKVREHRNITGNVPTISEAIRLALSLGSNPRVVRASIDGAANVLLATINRKHERHLLDGLAHQCWAFTHQPIKAPGEQAHFTILATF